MLYKSLQSLLKIRSMKSVFTHFLAFFALLFFECFSRLIISFYHRVEFSFYGIADLPNIIWVVAILASVLISTWLVTMLILTIINENFKFHATVFALIIISWRSIEIANSFNSEPVWYFAVVLLLHLIGISLAYYLYRKQHEKLSTA